MIDFFKHILQSANNWGFAGIITIVVFVSVIELAIKLFEHQWTKNESIIDIFCLFVPFVIQRPLYTYFAFWFLPLVMPHGQASFTWIPFWWSVLIITVIEDLVTYWQHRLHHELPFLWRLHRTHHSAPYMGIMVAGRQCFISSLYLSFMQFFIVATATYLGLGYAAMFYTVMKTLLIYGAHTSIRWDKPFYKYRILHPVAWVMERVISTPATHHAHHAETCKDGIGHYNGNYASALFIWDIIFKTGKITRQYPKRVGLKHYKKEEWYVQLLWPLFKSKKEGSELAKNAPVDDGVL